MPSISNHRIAHLRSLIIDDSQAMRQNLRTQLGQIGINHVDQAGSANEAIKFVLKDNYDLILSDYNLNSETNGQQLLEHLRSQGMLSPTTIFIMITAESSYDQVASAAEFQPDAYMVKPLTGGQIESRIERLLDKQHALRQINGRLKLKDIAGTIAECDKLITQDPKWSIEAMKIKGKALLELDNAEEAREVYRKALDMRADLTWAKLGLARCDQAAGLLSDARAKVLDVLEQNDKYVVAYDLLAQVAEAEGKEEDVLEALDKSCKIVPSARRSRMVGEVAYRTGNLEQAREAFDKVLHHTRGSLTAQPSDALQLAQVHVDAGDAEQALQVLSAASKEYGSSVSFSATRAAVEAQAQVKLGDLEAAQKAFETAKELSEGLRADATTLALAKAAFSIGKDDEGADILSKAVQADHENKRIVSLARKVLKDTGKEALSTKVIDQAVNDVMSIVSEANALMRGARVDESLAKLEEALKNMPENTGVLLAAAQLHLLWMSQRGLNLEYVERVNSYLAKLDVLIPGSERVAKMYRFLRETLSRVAKKA